MIDYTKMSNLREAVKDGKTSNEIMKLARDLVAADDGYTYTRAWLYGYSKEIYIGFNIVVKAYNDCPDKEYNDKVKKFIMDKFSELKLTQLYLDDVQEDSYLIGTLNIDCLIEKENEDDN